MFSFHDTNDKWCTLVPEFLLHKSPDSRVCGLGIVDIFGWIIEFSAVRMVLSITEHSAASLATATRC